MHLRNGHDLACYQTNQLTIAAKITSQMTRVGNFKITEW